MHARHVAPRWTAAGGVLGVCAAPRWACVCVRCLHTPECECMCLHTCPHTCACLCLRVHMHVCTRVRQQGPVPAPSGHETTQHRLGLGRAPGLPALNGRGAAWGAEETEGQGWGCTPPTALPARHTAGQAAQTWVEMETPTDTSPHCPYSRHSRHPHTHTMHSHPHPQTCRKRTQTHTH